MILSKATIGKYRVLSILGGRNLISKLGYMGILIDSKIEVVDNERFIPLLIKVRGSEFAIGRGMASKIEVIEE